MVVKAIEFIPVNFICVHASKVQSERFPLEILFIKPPFHLVYLTNMDRELTMIAYVLLSCLNFLTSFMHQNHPFLWCCYYYYYYTTMLLPVIVAKIIRFPPPFYSSSLLCPVNPIPCPLLNLFRWEHVARAEHKIYNKSKPFPPREEFVTLVETRLFIWTEMPRIACI